MALRAIAPSLLCVHGWSAAAQVVAGEVRDSSGAALAGTRVQALTPRGATRAEAVTDGSGRFRLPPLPAGAYALLARRQGFRDLRQALAVNGDQTLTLTLAVAAAETAVTVQGGSPLMTESPTAQTRAEVGRKDFENAPALTVAEALALAPGVTFTGGNGPRDVSISVRGSNERQAYGVRNLQVFEDGFPVTQPDGTARADLADPHAYSGLTVVEGPSSALYGNYATGGALNFHLRGGSEIQGLEAGADFGSLGYFNDYAAFGAAGRRYQAAVFVSNVRADQATENSRFNTVTANLLATAEVSARDRLTLKFINNNLDTRLPIRLSLNQYRANPYQQGCGAFSTAASGCASVRIFPNGSNGTQVSETAGQAALGRHDRRTIAGLRWEHDLTDRTLGRGQFVFDDRDINQPTSALAYRGPYPSVNATGELTRRTGRATSYGGVFFNREQINSLVNNLAPGSGVLGGLSQTAYGAHRNAGARGRLELHLAERWSLVAGLGVEWTALHGASTAFSYPAAGAPLLTRTTADRAFFNIAPEAALQYAPAPALRLHTRFGAGYGTPQLTQLFITPQGTAGNNTALRTQRLYGIDWGADWTTNRSLQATAVGFYEWFHDEQVTQSPGVSLQSFTFNAPRSEHRGVEAALDWHPLPDGLAGLRLRASYLYDNQAYTRYTEQLASGAAAALFNRAGRRIPGVQPHFFNGRVEYDQPSGRFEGLGAYLEANWRDRYPLDNANLLAAPGYTLWNLSTHWDPPPGRGALPRMRFFYDVQNLLGRTYVGTAGNLTDALTAQGGEAAAGVLANAGGSIYAGTPRAFYGGVRMRF